jgi:hypothetical protein
MRAIIRKKFSKDIPKKTPDDPPVSPHDVTPSTHVEPDTVVRQMRDGPN